MSLGEVGEGETQASAFSKASQVIPLHSHAEHTVKGLKTIAKASEESVRVCPLE